MIFPVVTSGVRVDDDDDDDDAAAGRPNRTDDLAGVHTA